MKNNKLCECGHFDTDHTEIDDNYYPCGLMDCWCDDFSLESKQ